MADGDDLTIGEGIPVILPSGAEFMVLTDREKDYLEERVTRYTTDNHFLNISDFQDIDRMVTFELFQHRWNLWLSKGFDYWNEAINHRELAGRIAEFSKEIRQIKKDLGLDKVARDKARGDDSWAAYLDKLRRRAMEFGVTRNRQHAKSIELFQQLVAIITLHDNCDEQERRENNVTVKDVFEWLREIAIPEFQEIDLEFMREHQSMWIREM